jgi:hypothetical protein
MTDTASDTIDELWKMSAFGRKQTVANLALSGRCAPKAATRVLVFE